MKTGINYILKINKEIIIKEIQRNVSPGGLKIPLGEHTHTHSDDAREGNILCI